jgi:hypothetical protein
MKSFSSWTMIGMLGLAASLGLYATACGGGSDAPSTSNGGGSNTSAGGAGGSDGGAGGLGGDGGYTDLPTVTGTNTTPPCNATNPDADTDGDGFTPNTGDCNDCDANVNPDAVEVPTPDDGAPVDENCNDLVDELPAACDDALAMNSEDPIDGARAIGLCEAKQIVSAKWVLADGAPPPVDALQLKNFHLGHGIVEPLGPMVNPQEGAKMLMVSSGTARPKDDLEYVHRNFAKGYGSGAPVGFPKESPECPGVVTKAPMDATGLELEIKVPMNALSFTFDFNFFTFEWPQFICTEFNDFFIANLTPFPETQSDGNISFDDYKNPISVNNAFLSVCGCPSSPGQCVVPPATPTKPFDCIQGTDRLLGTAWENDKIDGWSNGSSGWLVTSAPVEKGSIINIRFVTYDSSDMNVDSTALVDNWVWHAEAGTVGTKPIPIN